MELSFNELKKNLKKDFSKLKKIKVALLADSASQLLSQSLRGYAFSKGFNLEIFEGDFGQVDGLIFNTSSALYKFKPQIIIVFESLPKITENFYKLSRTQKANFASHQRARLIRVNEILSSRLGSKIIYFNIPALNDGVYGSYTSKIKTSLSFQLIKFNYVLQNLCVTYKDFFLFDFDTLVRRCGQDFCFEPKTYVNASMVLSIDVLPLVAKGVVDIIEALNGNVKKCIILDLDNTLWGGVIGDDGMENIQIGHLGIGPAFSQLQLWLKQLAERGIILAIASKNDEKIAKEPFLKHPDMILKLSDIAVFVANWNSKIDNIRAIQKTLNIDFDSMIFIDDNPLEREVIKKSLPKITVPDLPQDPAEYLNFLQSENLFETVVFSKEDKKRLKSYQQESKRMTLSKISTSESDFLENLNMVASVTEFSAFDIPRIAELTQRSNQFNLRTVRYSEEEIRKIVDSREYLTLNVRLKDKFGDLGLISLVILERRGRNFFVDTWIMSCRVLGRGVENLLLDYIVERAKKNKIGEIIGEYLKTPKNGLVKDHYRNLGFKKERNYWKLNIMNYSGKKHFIKVN